MHVNDKFHHTMQFHSALSLQKVALPYPFFLFSAIVVFTLHSVRFDPKNGIYYFMGNEILLKLAKVCPIDERL